MTLEPDNIDALNDVGSVYEITKNFLQAISTYRRALKVNPLHEETNFNLANAYFSLYLSNPRIVNLDSIAERLYAVLAQNPDNRKVRDLLNKIKSS